MTFVSRRSMFLIVSSLALAALPGCRQTLECPDDRVACDGRCVALEVDPAHCGSCGRACGTGETCGLGECRTAEVNHCGAENRACGDGERCVGGRCIAALYAACFNSDEVQPASPTLALAGPPIDVAPGPIALAELDGELYVASARPRQAEKISRIARDPPQVRSIPLRWSSDATPDIQFLAAHEGYLYVSHSSLGTLLVLTPAGDVVEEHAFVGAGEPNPNPLGLAFSGDRAYVALNARNEVAVLDVSSVGCEAPPCIEEVTRVNVQPLASPGADAKPARIAVAGQRAFVTLWNYQNWSPPAGSTGRLAVIDLGANTLDTSAGPGGLVDLGAGCLDPSDVAVDGATLWVACGAFDASDFPVLRVFAQGLVPIDLSQSPPVVGAILPAPADAAPGTLAFCAGGKYVADRNSGRVFRLDPEEGAVDGAELCPRSNGFAYVADLACGY
ncbi:MAG TPA: hypothetical protein VEB43_10685 [Anaeromyxobacter sp.]|nr:hypothetical protein [Anaeromyxobacter sp.]